MRDRKVLQEALEAGVCMGLPGICLAVSCTDKDTSGDSFFESFSDGYSDLSKQTLLRHDHLYGIGSITKVFVAVIVLQLVEEGCLDLDRSVFVYLPDDPCFGGLNNGASIRQLLQHQSGIPTWEFQDDWIRDARGVHCSTRIWHKHETLQYLKDVPCQPPGIQFSYSNTNYTLLGLLIEHATGNEFADELQKRILDPLELKDTYLDGFSACSASRRPVNNYHFATTTFRNAAGISTISQEHSRFLVNTSLANLSTEFTAGGMISTMQDLNRFGVAVRDGTLLSKAMHDELFRYCAPATNTVGDDSSGATGKKLEDGGDYYCHGICRKERRNGYYYGHGGLVLGFCSSMLLFDKTVVTVATNVGSMHSGLEQSPWDFFVDEILLGALEEYLGESPLRKSDH